jgi:hypothetical protein
MQANSTIPRTNKRRASLKLLPPVHPIIRIGDKIKVFVTEGTELEVLVTGFECIRGFWHFKGTCIAIGRIPFNSVIEILERGKR